MKLNKKLFFTKNYLCVIPVLFLLLFCQQTVTSQEYKQIPSSFEGRHHMLSPDELTRENTNLKNFQETPPPDGGARNIAEWETNQGVVIRGTANWNIVRFGIPYHLIASMSEHVTVYIITENTTHSERISQTLANNNVNMDNIEYIYGPSDGYWTRDFTPWFIEYGDNNDIGLINFPYNRPRPNDDNVPFIVGEHFQKEVFGMPLVHTGGNFMCDGYGIAASCDLVYEENSNLSDDDINNMVYEYLGITDYHLVFDPLDEYIEHIDCWGKFLAPDKILITAVPESDYRYDDFEAMADYWANQTSSYGNKFTVYRTYSPNGQPYSNSLIMNNRVYVPIIDGVDNQYNIDAIEVYEQAMPGYEIVMVENNTLTPWEPTDALHCRTYQVPDFEMLRIVHYPIIDTINYVETVKIEANIYSMSSSVSLNENASLFYSINQSEFNQINMTNTSDDNFEAIISNINNNDKVCYYIKATNDNSRLEKHPYMGEHDPHCFYLSGATDILDADIKESYIKAFPNPVYNRLSIVTKGLKQGDNIIQIYDSNGKIVINKTISVQNDWQRFNINISELNSGIYFIKVLSKNGTFSERFIKI